jgi:hypothetical protein
MFSSNTHTFNGQLVQRSSNHSADKVLKGVQPVEPVPPESHQSRLGDSDTTEQREDNQEEGVEKRSNEDRGTESSDCLTQEHGEDLSDKDHGELVTGSRTLVLTL